MISLQNLLDNDKCYEALRQARWPNGVRCPHCGAATVTKQGRDTTQPARQKYHCQAGSRYFDDRTGTVFAGHHQPLSDFSCDFRTVTAVNCLASTDTLLTT